MTVAPVVAIDRDPCERIETGADSEPGNRSVLARAATVIGAFRAGEQRLTLTELGRRTHLPKSTVYRLAEQLVELGWLEREPYGYRIGVRLFELGALAGRRSTLRERAMPHLALLAARTGLAVNLAIADGHEIVYLERIPMRGVELPTCGRTRMPAASTALGKAMLAFADDAARDDVARHGLEQRTPHTIVDRDRFRAELEAVKEKGFALDQQECFPGISCAAAPLRNSGRAIASVSATGPSDRFNNEIAVDAVRAAAAAIWSDVFGSVRVAARRVAS